MDFLNKTGVILSRLGLGLFRIAGKQLYLVFVYPLSPIFKAAKYFKLAAATSLDIFEKTSLPWRNRHNKGESNIAKPVRDFQWCLSSWGVTDTTIDDRILLWAGEILVYLFLSIIITWAALQRGDFWSWLELFIAVPALIAFAFFRGWQIACLKQRTYIKIIN